MKKYTKDQFAKFIFRKALQISNYNFDMFYDISKITKILFEKRGVSTEKQKDVLHLMLRSTGCDLISPDDVNYKIYNERTDKVYKLEFCWNEDYFLQ